MPIHLGETLCQTPEEFKAWSQNIGHDQVMTTFTSYGVVATGRQKEILGGIATRKTKNTDTISGDPDDKTVLRVLAYLSNSVS